MTAPASAAQPRQIDAYHWQGVERIVAIGDIHGDYRNYIAALRAAGIVDARDRWIAGQTHLVQTGDIPDRGPDTRRIIAHMRQLAKQARKQGGRVHNLIGNHEAMNVDGDLRYVSAGEYAAFVTSKSAALRERYFVKLLASLEDNKAEDAPALPADFKAEWEKTHPLGWVEHRLAWDPAWNPDGEYVRWVMQAPVAIQIDGTIFVHGGISGAYCRNSLASLTEQVHAALRRADRQAPSILDDDNGPLWYRGMSGVKPEATPETVTAILQQHGARRIVVGHTPTQGAIWPRFDGRVIQIDTGLSAYYGGHVAWLELTPQGAFAGYRAGKVRLPETDAARVAYLKQVVALQPANAQLKAQLAALEAAPSANGPTMTANETAASDQPKSSDSATPMPTCGISP